jgi:hypothetical protein
VSCASQAEVLDWISRGVNVTKISTATSWPPRQIQLLASRHGYLLTADGTPYQPPKTKRPQR